MKQTLAKLLEALYGVDRAPAITRRLLALIDDWRLRLPRRGKPRAVLDLTQRDAWLITYADQVHAPDTAPLQTLADFCARHLNGLISGLHILPFYPWSSDDGFSVKDFYAVEPSYGSWEDLDRLGKGFELMFDAVFNHASAQGLWFQQFRNGDSRYQDFFVTVEDNPDLTSVIRPRTSPLLTEFSTATGTKKIWTTFSADQVDLNFKNPGVLLAVVEVLLHYVSKGARFIRLDAVAFLWKEIGTRCLHRPQTHRLIQLLRAVLDELAPQVLLITETNVPHADNLSYFGDGTNEAQLVYNFALPPLVLQAFLAQNAGKLTAWAQSLALPSDHVTFFNFLASHDGIGLNPARGILSETEISQLVENTRQHGGFVSDKRMPDGSLLPYELNINYLDALSHRAFGEPDESTVNKMLTAHAILLSLQGVPGIYFHSLFGSRGDRIGAEACGIKRRINREKLDQARLETELARSGSLRARVFAGMRNLLRIRQGQSAFHPQARQRILALDPRLLVVCRTPPDPREQLVSVHNVSSETVPVPNLGAELAGGSECQDLLTGQVFGLKRGGASPVELTGFQTVWLQNVF